MKLNRRSFLVMGLAAVGGGVGFVSLRQRRFLNAQSNIVLGGSQYMQLDGTKQMKFGLSIVNLDLRKQHFVSLDFLPHGIISDPLNPYRLVLFEKIGPGAAIVNLKSEKLVKKIPTDSGRYFYGHGAFNRKNRHLYATETYRASAEGVVIIRDADSMKITGEFPSYGSSPHECQLINNDEVLVVTNGGGDGSGPIPNVAYIDVKSQKLIEKVMLTNSQLNTGHIGIAKDGSLVVASAPRMGLATTDKGGVSIRPQGEILESIAEPSEIVARMTGEALSVVVHDETGIAAVTHPAGNLVTFWSIADRGLLKTLELPNPRGVSITRDFKRFIISYGLDTSLIEIDIASLTPLSETIFPASYISGSHVYNWSGGLEEFLSLSAFT